VVKTTESQPTSIAAEKPQSGAPSAGRLVIRVKLPRADLPSAPLRRRPNKVALALILAAVAIVLSWLGVSIFRSDPAPAPTASEAPPPSQSQSPAPVLAPIEAAPVVKDEPVPKAATETQQPAASPALLKEVIPDVPRSARETIRGTVRVSIRVIVGKDGTVLAATADEPGPSRYFERLAMEASRQWMFAAIESGEQRVMLVRFYFKRGGTSARASSVQ